MRNNSTGEKTTRAVSRRKYLQLGAGASAVAVAGCLGSDGEAITYINRGGAVLEAEREVMDRWGEENDIEIEYQEAAEDTEMFEIISESPDRFDLASVSPYGYALNQIAYEGEILGEIDLDQVPNYTENVKDEWQDVPFLENDLGIFYHISTQGIGYNTDYVDDISSWEDIKDSDLDGHLSLFDSAPTRFGNACAARDVDPVEALEDDSLYDEVAQEMREQHENVFNYWAAGNQFMQLLREDQAHATSAWGGRVEILADEGHSVDYTVPEEGCITWSLGFSLVEGTEMREEVHDLLNWLYQEEIAIEMAEHHKYPIPLESEPDAMTDRFEYVDSPDDVLWFDWERVIPHLEDIEQTFNEIKAE